MSRKASWRGPMRTFRVTHYSSDGSPTHVTKVDAHQVSLPARGMHYYDYGGEWLVEVAKNITDGADVVRLYAEVEGDWTVVFEAPEGSVSVRETERAR